MSFRLKGVAISINAMIGIVLIVIFLAVMLGFQQQIFKGLMGFIAGVGITEEFKIEKEAVDSMNAFACASNYLVGELDACNKGIVAPFIVWDAITGKYLVYASPTEKLKKIASYGNVEVYCNDDRSKCIIKNFELPQEIDNSYAYINVFKDPKYIMYYEKFPRGEEVAWTSLLNGENKLVGVGIAALSGAAFSFVKLPTKIVKSLNRGSIPITKYFLKEVSSEKRNVGIILSQYIVKKYVRTANKEEEKKAVKQVLDYLEGRTSKVVYKEINKEELDAIRNAYTRKLNEERAHLITTLIMSLEKPNIGKYVKDIVVSLNDLPEETAEAYIKANAKTVVRLVSSDPYLALITAESIGSTIGDDIPDEIIEGIKCSAVVSSLPRNPKISSTAVCGALFYLAHTFNSLDMINEKYSNVGYNTLALYSPEYYVKGLSIALGKKLSVKIPLSPNLENYGIVLKRNDNSYERFYLASPCYADLVMEKKNLVVKPSQCKTYHLAESVFKGDYYSNIVEPFIDVGLAGGLFFKAEDGKISLDNGMSLRIDDVFNSLCDLKESQELKPYSDKLFYNSESIRRAENLCACKKLYLEGLNDDDNLNKCYEYLRDPSIPFIIRLQPPLGNSDKPVEKILMLNVNTVIDFLEDVRNAENSKNVVSIESIADYTFDVVYKLQEKGYFMPCSLIKSDGKYYFAEGIYYRVGENEYLPIDVEDKEELLWIAMASGSLDVAGAYISTGDSTYTTQLYIYKEVIGGGEPIEGVVINVPVIEVSVNGKEVGKENFCYTGRVPKEEKVAVYALGFALDTLGYVLGFTLGNIVPGVGTGAIIAGTSAISSALTYWLESELEEDYMWPDNGALNSQSK